MLDSEDQPPSEIAVLLTDEKEIQRLNLQFRKVNSATDVLSFAAGQGPEKNKLHALGDIAICLPIAEKQAANHSLPLETELSYLAVHGGLHLLGYGHETKVERFEMLAKMNNVIRSLGLEPMKGWSSNHG